MSNGLVSWEKLAGLGGGGCGLVLYNGRGE